MKKCGMTPIWAPFLSLGSVAVQYKASEYPDRKMKTSDLPPRWETESVHSTTANIIATNVSVVILYLQHVVDDCRVLWQTDPGSGGTSWSNPHNASWHNTEPWWNPSEHHTPEQAARYEIHCAQTHTHTHTHTHTYIHEKKHLQVKLAP